MKKKVSRYQGGGVLRDRYGNPVRSGSGDPVRTRYPESSSRESSVDIEERSTKSPRLMEEEASVGPMDYATMGRRAGASSMMGGPKLDIKEDVSETEYEPPKAREMPSGVASGFKAKDYLEEIESKGGGPRSETKPAVAKKKIKKEPSRYEDTGAKIGNQSFNMESTKPAAEAKSSGMGPKLSFLTKERLEKSKEAMRQSNKPNPADVDATRRRAAGMFRPMNEAVYGMKKGGKVSSASSRADGIAQRGKTRGRIC